MLKYLRFVYYKDFFPCTINTVPGGKQVLGNVTELVQEVFQLQLAIHNCALFPELLTITDLVQHKVTWLIHTIAQDRKFTGCLLKEPILETSVQVRVPEFCSTNEQLQWKDCSSLPWLLGLWSGNYVSGSLSENCVTGLFQFEED